MRKLFRQVRCTSLLCRRLHAPMRTCLLVQTRAPAGIHTLLFSSFQINTRMRTHCAAARLSPFKQIQLLTTVQMALFTLLGVPFETASSRLTADTAASRSRAGPRHGAAQGEAGVWQWKGRQTERPPRTAALAHPSPRAVPAEP